MRPTLAACLSLLAALLLLSADAHAEERILEYHSDIAIAADGSMEVAEHVTVVAEGDQFRHGIYRDFPTDYEDLHGNDYVVGFEVLGAQLDGAEAPWHSEQLDNGVRVYVGDAESLVSHGQHEYLIRYRTSRQLGFFEDHDELYWNVTGTGWAVPIDHASATVHLPVEVPANKLQASGYTGDKLSKATELATRLLDDGAAYETTRRLGPHQNLSIVLEFPKGIITPPTPVEEAANLLKDNFNLLLGVVGFFVLWLFYLWTWHRLGRDPDDGPLVALYEPPDGDSAAALRYVDNMGYDKTCLSAGVLDLAAHGQLAIEQDEDEDYTLIKTAQPSTGALQTDNRALLEKLFEDGERVELKQKNHKQLQAAQEAHKKALALEYEKKYFVTNTRHMWPGLVISILTIIGLFWSGRPERWFALLWLGPWTGAVFFLIANAIRNRTSSAWFMAVVFTIGGLVGFFFLGKVAGYVPVLGLVALLTTNCLFYQWMKAPTQLGAEFLDRIRGFRWYLGVAEKQELDSRYKPESRPELFGQFLPYAVALDVDNEWAERFASALTPAQMREAQPTWYHGSHAGAFTADSFSSFSDNIGSGLSGVIASSSTSPGSSSGGGGGGFSGGGGGGGGGGGW